MIDLARDCIIATVCFGLGVLVRDVAQDYRDIQAVAKKPRQAQVEPAPLWSKRCEAQDKRIFATQADGKRWRIKCVDATGMKT